MSITTVTTNDNQIRFQVRQMKVDDVEAVLEIWALNNLHEGTNTIQSFMVQDSEGFVVAVEMDETSEDNSDNNENNNSCDVEKQRAKQTKTGNKLKEKRIIGMCAGIFVHPTIAFIGLYGVLPELHGRGIGISMWNEIMNHIGSLNAGLYAVPEHLIMYRDRAGFHQPDERLLLIYESDSDTKLKDDILVPSIRGTKISKITAEWYKRVIEYDSNIHGYIRGKLLPRVFTEQDTAAFVASDISGQEIYGYGCIRTNNIGKAMIGPLYSDNDAVAELLMRYLFVALSGPLSKGLLYMTLDSNPGGERIADKLGLIKQEQIARFFRNKPYINADWDRVYCVHSPNFSLL